MYSRIEFDMQNKKKNTHKWKQSIPEDSKFIYIVNEYMNDKQIVQKIT